MARGRRGHHDQLNRSSTAFAPGARVPGTLAADFDRDGLADVAHLERAGTGHRLVVTRGAGAPAVIAAVRDPAAVHLELLGPGTYRTACGKGLGPAHAPCPGSAVRLDGPTLAFGTREASQAIALWDGSRFRVVWLSD